MDVTSCSHKSLGGNKYVHVKMDFGSGKKWCSFMKTKKKVPKDSLKFVNCVVGKKGKPPSFIRLDNSGENVKMSESIKEKYPSIKFEFTARKYPSKMED